MTFTRTNLCANPTFESGVSLWGNYAESTLTQSSSFARTGTYSMRLDRSTTRLTAVYGASSTGTANTESMPVAVGQTVTVSMYVRQGSGTMAPFPIIMWQTAAGALIGAVINGSSVSVNSTWQRLTLTAVAPATAATFGVGVRVTTTSAGQYFFVDDVLVEQGPWIGDYFDGSTTDTGWADYGWTGTANASTSTVAYTGRVNLLANPSFEVDSNAWTSATRTLGSSSGIVGGGVACGSMTAPVSAKQPATAGLDYTASGWFTRGSATRNAGITVRFYDSAGAEISAPTVTQTALALNSVPERRSVTRTAPAGTVSMAVTVSASGGISGDAFLLEQSSSLSDYFGMETKAPDITYTATGTVHGSPTVEASTPGTTVSWNDAFSSDGTTTTLLARGLPLPRTNIAFNGSAEGGLSGWTGDVAGVTPTLNTNVSHVVSGAQSILATNTSAAALTSTLVYGDSTPYRMSAVAGDIISVQGWVKNTSGTISSRSVVYWYNGAGTLLTSSTGSLTGANASTFSAMRQVVTAPANTASFSVGFRTASLPVGVGFYVDNVIVERNVNYNTSINMDAYFDGDSADTADYDYAWSGTAYLSNSTETRKRRLNMFTNPSLEASSNGWATPGAGALTMTRSTEQAMFGTYSHKYVVDSAGTASITSTLSGITVTPGRVYTFSAYVRPSRATTALIRATSSLSGNNNATTTPANQWTRVTSVGYTLGANGTATAADFRLSIPGMEVGDTIYVDGVLFEEGMTLGGYFDGSSTKSSRVYAWTGTAHESSSTEVVGAAPIDSTFSGSGTTTTAWSNYVNIASAFSSEGTTVTLWAAYRNIYSDFSSEGTVTTLWSDYRDIFSGFSGEGTVTTLVTGASVTINSVFDSEGTLTTALTNFREMFPSFDSEGTVTTSGVVNPAEMDSFFTGSGTVATLLVYSPRLTSAFSGEGILFTVLGYAVAPLPLGTEPLGKLERFSVSTSAVPLNPAEGSSSTPSVSASYTKGLDPEFMLGETNVLSNGAVGTYEGEVVKLALAEASGLASLAMNTPLTLLNNELHLFPFIDGVPGLWTAARAIDYWTQQCGLFYDKVPGEAIAYASGFGHTDSYGADTTARFYEKLTGGTTSTSVLNERSVRTMGAAVTGTTALHEVEDGTVTVSLPKNRKLVFSIGLGLLGTGRTSTATWSFLDNAGRPHEVSLAATSAGAITAKIGGATVASASVPAGQQYRLAFSLERLSSTALVGKLTVHTDDLAGAGTLEHDGVSASISYALPGVLRLTALTHASAGGSGAEMVRWGTYLTVAAEHPLELPAVQKVLAQTKKEFGFVSGFEGNVWAMLAEFCAIARLDVGFRDRQLHVGPRTQTLTLPGGSFSRFENNWERRDKYKQVALVNKQSKAVTTDDAVLWRADSVFQVAAREVFETTVQTGHSILSLVQPQPVTGILPYPYTQGGGQYVVTGADGYIIAPAWWNDNGGKVEVSLTGKEGEIAIKITAPALDNVRAPYRISEGAADRPALYVSGSGIVNDPVEVHVGTGARNAKEGFDSVFESPFLAGVRETFDTAAAMAHEYSASHAETSFELPNSFETPTGFGQFPAGTLFTDNVRNYRIMDASQTHSRVSGNAVPHTTIGAYVASYPEGSTIADEKARHAGRTIRQFNIKPLKGA